MADAEGIWAVKTDDELLEAIHCEQVRRGSAE